MNKSYDAIVIGGGSAGLAFATTAAGYGASILLIEADCLGGTCVNRGCVPKKMTWAVADALRAQSALADEGIFSHPPVLDMPKLVARRRARIDEIVQSYSDELDQKGITRVHGTARLTGAFTVTVKGNSYNADRIILATGARPAPLDITGADLAQTSDEVFGWTEAPKHLLVIGGGYIGCEMAAIFNGLGSEVTLVSDGDSVLTEFSAASQKIAAKNLQASGVTLHFNARPESFERDGDGRRAVLSDGTTLSASAILNATGRNPNLDIFDGLPQPAQADTGALAVNDRFETSLGGIYAIGDCADRLPLTPVARADGKTLATQLFGDSHPAPIDLRLVATTAFVFPPIGEVGHTDAIKKITTFTAMDSMIKNSTPQEGWALHFNDTDHLTGASIVGHAAAEAVSWAAPLIHSKQTRTEISNATPVHPSRAEEPLA